MNCPILNSFMKKAIITRMIFLFIVSTLSVPALCHAVTVDELGKTTVYLRKNKPAYELKAGKPQEVWYKDPDTEKFEQKLDHIGGTGFLVEHTKRIYLVTAAHVARDMTGDAETIWKAASGQIRIYNFDLVQKSIPGAMWFFHPSADIAVHPFGFAEKADHILISEEIFADEKEKINLLTKASVLGYPFGLGINDVLSPLAKRTEIASWVTTIDNPVMRKDLKFILLDDDLAQGYSGAPVFISSEPQMNGNAPLAGGAQTKIIGIESMGISDQTGGKISLVVPIFYLVDIFNSKEFKDYEKIPMANPVKDK